MTADWTLDASAVVCWLNGEPGYTRVVDVLGNPSERAIIHAVNLAEVRYFYLRRGEAAMEQALAALDAAGVEISRAVDDALLAVVAEVKAHHAPVSLADAFAVACAAVEDASLLTTDRGELEKIALAGICRIEFLR